MICESLRTEIREFSYWQTSLSSQSWSSESIKIKNPPKTLVLNFWEIPILVSLYKGIFVMSVFFVQRHGEYDNLLYSASLYRAIK
jgi:hypothetical protein